MKIILTSLELAYYRALKNRDIQMLSTEDVNEFYRINKIIQENPSARFCLEQDAYVI